MAWTLVYALTYNFAGYLNELAAIASLIFAIPVSTFLSGVFLVAAERKKEGWLFIKTSFAATIIIVGIWLYTLT
ncbi:MAG: hypothetical protein ABJG68_06580 [Crocinitomicaceae bacterium]